MPTPPTSVGIIGGTGPAGRGLATRLAAAGIAVAIGSRSADRAEAAVVEVRRAAGRELPLRGVTNEQAAAAEVVVLATPWDGAVATAQELAEPLSGKVVVSMINALTRFGRELQALVPVRGSLAATLQAELPRSSVSAAFHHLPAGRLAALEEDLDADVLVCADGEEAAATTVALVDAVPGLRGVRAGSLASANAVEALTAVLLNVNRHYKAHVSLRLSGLAGER